MRQSPAWQWCAVALMLCVDLGAQMKPGTIEGTVKAEADGPPVKDIEVSAGSKETRTDEAGRYTLRDVPPGRAQVMVGGRPRSVATATRTIVVGEGQTVTSDFSIPLRGGISGKVLDENDEGVPGVEVALIAREFGAGALRYFRRSVTRTNDEGAYRLPLVNPGVPYLLLFRKMDGRKMAALSDAPTEPKLRRPTAVPVYYPGSPDPEGGSLITLRGGEQRDGINVRLPRAPSFCVEGVLTDRGRPAAMTFQIAETHLSFGLGASGGVTGLPPMGDSGPDGRIRICDLHPGEYRLTAFTGNINQPDSIASTTVSIRDKDVQNITLQPVPKLAPVAVELAWGGDPPEKAIDSKVGLSIWSTNRSFGAFAGAPPSAIPGESVIRDLLLDEYFVRVTGLTGRLYLKELTYGNESIAYNALRAGAAATGVPVKMTIGHDGAQLNIRISDKDGNAIPHAAVLVMPAVSASDAEFAARTMTGQADQNGDYPSRALMPGMFIVMAFRDPVGEWNPELVSKLRAARNHATEVSLDPGATVELKLSPITFP